jgi:AmmeMemoRadiSam system protein A
MTAELTRVEKVMLLRLARQGLQAAVRGEAAPPLAAAARTPALERPGCSFVTLTEDGQLRGCIGGLQADEPLWRDVQRHAGQAALSDYRFIPVQPAELPQIEIEVSVLSAPAPLDYAAPDELLRQLRPHVDGVVLRQGLSRATFLPQVWESVPEPEQFLAMLCEKLGLPPDAWRRQHLAVETYQVEEFREPEFAEARTGQDAPPERPTT